MDGTVGCCVEMRFGSLSSSSWGPYACRSLNIKLKFRLGDLGHKDLTCSHVRDLNGNQ